MGAVTALRVGYVSGYYGGGEGGGMHTSMMCMCRVIVVGC